MEDLHPSDSKAQQDAEKVILSLLEQKLGISLRDDLKLDQKMKLDGFSNSEPPTCVEIFARIGACKIGQQRKIFVDLAKMLLIEKLLGKPCRKIVVFADEAAMKFFRNSWKGSFIEEFGFEICIVKIPDALRTQIETAQKRQYR